MKVTTITKKEFIQGIQYDKLIDKQEEKDKQYCYKPYRTLHNYLGG